MKSLISLFSLLISFTVIANKSSTAAEEIPEDLDGNSIDPFNVSDGNTIVLVFAGVDCPISNRYVPAINRLYKNYGSKNFSFWIIYPGSYFDSKEVESHLKEYQIKAPALIDRKGYLVKKTGATVTPEVAVYAPSSGNSLPENWIYRGRIDNRYTDFGKWRAEPSREDLKEVLQSIADGQRPETRETQAIGCYIVE